MTQSGNGPIVFTKKNTYSNREFKLAQMAQMFKGKKKYLVKKNTRWQQPGPNAQI
jgi:hypothetical protein